MKRVATKTMEEFGIRRIKDRKLSIGLDLGDRSSFYCRLDESGDVILERKVSTTAKALAEAFAEMPRSRIALETGAHSPWVSQLLSAQGHEVIVKLFVKEKRLSGQAIYQGCHGTEIATRDAEASQLGLVV